MLWDSKSWRCTSLRKGIAWGGTDLLEVGGEAVHVLVIGQYGVGLGVEEVDVPDAQQRQQNRSVLVQGSGAEVVVLRRRRRETCSVICIITSHHRARETMGSCLTLQAYATAYSH